MNSFCSMQSENIFTVSRVRTQPLYNISFPYFLKEIIYFCQSVFLFSVWFYFFHEFHEIDGTEQQKKEKEWKDRNPEKNNQIP